MSVFSTISDAVLSGRSPQDGEVNIEEVLGSKPGAADLDWQSSINDLLTLVGTEPTQANREALASELNFEGLDGSTKMNNRLHREVMRELTNRGVWVPHPWR